MSTRDRRKLVPPPELGVHGWLYGCASALRRDGLDQLTALSELSAHVAGSSFRAGRNVSSREIADAIESAFRSGALPAPPLIKTTTPGEYDNVEGWPTEMSVPKVEIDRSLLAQVFDAAGRFELVDLWENSPIQLRNCAAPRWVLGHLFEETDILCVGSSTAGFAAKSLAESDDEQLRGRQLIVPNALRKSRATQGWTWTSRLVLLSTSARLRRLGLPPS